MFASPAFTVFGAQENKGVVARKPCFTNSPRRPLADKSVNENKHLKVKDETKLSLKVDPVKKINFKPAGSKPFNDWMMFDTCSQKEVYDEIFENIHPKLEDLLAKSAKPPATPPPPQLPELDVMVLELPKENYFTFTELQLMEEPEDEVDFPECTFTC